MGVVTDFGRPEMLIGQPFKILVAFSTAIVQCQCEAKTVLVLPGKNRVTTCHACGKAFAIADSGVINIGEVIAQPPEAH
jgi:hypothetical protein